MHFVCCSLSLLVTKSVHCTLWQILGMLCCLWQIQECFAEDYHEEAGPQSSLEEITYHNWKSSNHRLKWHGLLVLIISSNHETIQTAASLRSWGICHHEIFTHPVRTEQIFKQHISSANGFPCFNTEPKLGSKHCLLQRNSREKKWIQYHKRTDRRHLISFLQCCNSQQLVNWILKSKLQQQQLTKTLNVGTHWWPRALPTKLAIFTALTPPTPQKGGKPQDVLFLRQAASPPCWVRSEGSMQSNPSTAPPAEHAVPQSYVSRDWLQPC